MRPARRRPNTRMLRKAALAAVLGVGLSGCAQPVCEGFKVPPPSDKDRPTDPAAKPTPDPAPPR